MRCEVCIHAVCVRWLVVGGEGVMRWEVCTRAVCVRWLVVGGRGLGKLQSGLRPGGMGRLQLGTKLMLIDDEQLVTDDGVWSQGPTHKKINTGP